MQLLWSLIKITNSVHYHFLCQGQYTRSCSFILFSQATCLRNEVCWIVFFILEGVWFIAVKQSLTPRQMWCRAVWELLFSILLTLTNQSEGPIRGTVGAALKMAGSTLLFYNHFRFWIILDRFFCRQWFKTDCQFHVLTVSFC